MFEYTTGYRGDFFALQLTSKQWDGGGCVGPIHVSSARRGPKNSGHIQAINGMAAKNSVPGPGP
jgi:hypothetical protein